MLLIDRQSWRKQWWHLPYFTVLGGAALGWCAVYRQRTGAWPNGSSMPGFVCGVTAGLLMIYEFLFVLRRVPLWKKWKFLHWFPSFTRTQARLRRHIWIGLLTAPLVLGHAAHLGRASWIALALTLVYLGVMASGLVYLLVQQWLPRRLLHLVPEETIYAQIPDLAEQLAQEAELLILATAGPRESEMRTLPTALKRSRALLGELRRGRGTGLLDLHRPGTSDRLMPKNPLPDCQSLWSFYDERLQCFLTRKRPENLSPKQYALALQTLGVHDRAVAVFVDLRGRVHPEAVPIVDALEQLCSRRRQFDRQIRYQVLMHLWLGIHVGLSVLLLALLAVHVVTAVWYW